MTLCSEKNRTQFLLQGNTPLHTAAQQGHADIVLSLLQRKANPNVANSNSMTPLHLAITYEKYGHHFLQLRTHIIL